MDNDEVARAILKYYELPTTRPVPFAGGVKADGLSHKELVERIVNDPGYRAQREAELNRNPELVAAWELYQEAAGELLAALARLGFPVRSVDDLYRLQVDGKSLDYRVAVPTLIEWLERTDYLPLMKDLVSALSYAFAKKQVRPVFLTLFRNLPPLRMPPGKPALEVARSDLRWTIGGGLAGFADPSVADEYLELAADRSYGKDRAPIVHALPKLKDDRVPAALLGQLDDPTVVHWAVRALGLLRLPEAREPIQKLLDSPPVDWSARVIHNVRTEARRAFKRIP